MSFQCSGGPCQGWWWCPSGLRRQLQKLYVIFLSISEGETQRAPTASSFPHSHSHPVALSLGNHFETPAPTYKAKHEQIFGPSTVGFALF